MDVLWPWSLLLLAIIPLLAGYYIWTLRRRRRFAVRYSSLALVRAALPRYSWLRRHLPFALLLAALASLIVALGRPVAVAAVPTSQATIMLALDVSRSMCSTDIAPNRLLAAEAAALDFVESQKASTRIGIVAFAGFAELITTPTTDPEILADAIESLTTGRRTAIGSGILEAIDAIAEIDGSVAPSVRDGSDEPPATPLPRGAYAPSIIVLLTDGASNAGPAPVEAAQQAADRGIRVYTIGFGTAAGGDMECGMQSAEGSLFGGGNFGGGSFGGGSFGGGGGSFGGGGFPRGIDEVTLKEVSDITGGEYFSAESAGELQSVLLNLPTSLITSYEVTEISFVFAAIGALLAAAAVGLALLWRPLP